MKPLVLAVRALRRRPAFAAAAILTLAFGIACTTTLFSVVDTVLLKALPYPGADRLVAVWEASPASHQRTSLIAPARLDDWRRMNRTFDALSGSYSENVTDTSPAEPERLSGRRVMPGYFSVFGTTPLAGRTFNAGEERDGGPTVAVISEDLWTRRYARNASAVGQRLTIGGRGFTIVGVMPRAFSTASVDVWLPAQLSPMLMGIREARFLGGAGRMKPGVTVDQARDDLARVQRLLGEQFPRTDRDWSATVMDMKDLRIGDYRRALTLVFGAVALLLTIAVANIAGLMLVQLHRRERELAIRSAIGASRGRVIAAVMSEVVVITIAGAGLGAVSAVWLVRLFASVFTTMPRMNELTLDWRAVAFTAAASFAAALAFGLIPALHATRGSLALSLAQGGRAVSGGRHRLQQTLVVAQVALGLVLAGCAGLLVRSYYKLTRVDAGFNPSHVITFHVGAAWDEDRARIGRLQEQLIAELQRRPGVQGAGFTNFLPATGATLRYQLRVEGLSSSDAGGRFTVGERTVTAGYLRAMQVPLVAGAWCQDARADPNAAREALVNRRFVDQYAPGQDLVGRQASFDYDPHGWQIVGIIGDFIEDGPGAQVPPYFYVCMAAGSWPDPEYVVRAAGDPRALMAQVREIVRSLDPSRAVFGVKPVADVIAGALDQPRLNARVLVLFAAAALALASLGLYSLLTLLVTERRRELGVRMALGAAPSEVWWLVLAGAARLVAAGLAAGFVLMLAAGRVLGAVLFGVGPLDLPALGGAVATLAVVALVATAIPARRAASLSALEALRDIYCR